MARSLVEWVAPPLRCSAAPMCYPDDHAGFLTAPLLIGSRSSQIWIPTPISLVPSHPYSQILEIDGVAPKAKMNQQCSRRFGTAKDKELEVSKMKHILPIWASFWSSKTSKSIHLRVRLGVRVSSLNHLELAMALAERFICSITGIDSLGGFHPSLDAILEGLGYAAPLIMTLLFILDDELVKLSPHARAIRDVEDEELQSFFYGMSPWQFILVVVASSVGEELFYRPAVQGALADIFLRGTDLVIDARGIASLTGVLPPFVPFAQAFAAIITAALTGSLYYVAASPKG